MRVERIEIEGRGPVSGLFVFPAQGLGLWVTPNDVPEGALVEAVACGLYGPPVTTDECPFTRIALHLRRDDGTSITIDRSMVEGTLDVASDGTEGLQGEEMGSPLGKQLLGLAREDFVLVAGIRSDELRASIAHRRLPQLLSAAEPPARSVEDVPSDAATSSNAGNFTVARPPFEAERATHEAGADPSGAASEAAPRPDDGTPTERLRKLRRALATAEQNLAARTDELHAAMEKQEELRAGRARLGLLTDAEPGDLERLNELAGLLPAALDRRDALVRERANFEQSLAAQGLDITTLQDLERRYAALSPADSDFLNSAEESTTIRRGNLALARSECRLDDTSLQEIDRARADASRRAMLPLVVAAAGLFAFLASLLFHAPSLVSLALILVGLGGGGAAAWTFWRARTLRESERAALLETLARKRRQMAELESEGQEVERRLAALGTRLGVSSARTLRQEWQRWTAASSARHEIEGFTRRSAEIEEQIIALRGKLGAFHFGGEADHDVDLRALQSMIDDYRRSFEMRAQIEEAEQRAARLEAEVAACESERSDVRMWIDAMLVEAGIDPARDLDEAVEMYAMRSVSGGAAGGSEEDGEEPTTRDARGDARRAEVPPPLVTTWIPRVSAAAEAILRRLIPDARELGVDDRLSWTFRPDPRGPRLSAPEVERTLSAAAVDQVCLAVRLAIVDTLSSTRERLPVFLDEPWARADDARHARGMEFLVEGLATRGQVVLRTSHEVRAKWFLHQSPTLRDRVVAIGPFTPEAAPVAPSGSLSPSSVR